MAALATKRALALAPPHTRTLFGFPSPFASSSSSSSSPTPPRKGTLKQQGGIWHYREHKLMPYAPQELFTVIADVDAYQQFLPFTSSSRVLRAARTTGPAPGQRRDEPVAERGWLEPGGEGERWDMDGELRIGAMGFDEGYVSLVEMEKHKWVKVRVRFPFLESGSCRTSRSVETALVAHARSPSLRAGHGQGRQHVPPPLDPLVLLPLPFLLLHPLLDAPIARRPLPRLRLRLAPPRRRDPVRVGQGERAHGRAVREAGRGRAWEEVDARAEGGLES